MSQDELPFPVPTKLPPPKRPLRLKWEPIDGVEGFALGTAGKVWKGSKGWWASRKGVAAIQGPFRGYRLAQTWVEEPMAEAERLWAEAKASNEKIKSQNKTSALDTKLAKTWGTLKDGDRELLAGQVWEHKSAKITREALIVEIRRETLVALVRTDEATPWKEAARDTLDPAGFLRVYRFKGTASLPTAKRHSVSRTAAKAKVKAK